MKEGLDERKEKQTREATKCKEVTCVLKKEMKADRESWIDSHCLEIEGRMARGDSKKGLPAILKTVTKTDHPIGRFVYSLVYGSEHKEKPISQWQEVSIHLQIYIIILDILCKSQQQTNVRRLER